MQNNKAVSVIKYMLEDVRRITLSGIKGLDKGQLFKEPVPGEFPIGAYLMHLVEVDIFWFEVASGKKMPEEFSKRCYYNNWYDSLEEKPVPPAEPIEVDEYLNLLAESRKIVLDYMDTLTDDDIEENIQRPRRDGSMESIPRKWILYHLIEHEAHHRGQMFMLMRMSGMKGKSENN
jgi:uncharacterized damage-inducible protein DinB